MTSKLTFRARTLDAAKPMSIHRAEELPELAAESAINRAVPALPTGMEKEEETEKHLQDILEAQTKGQTGRVAELVIPTPEVTEDHTAEYEETYTGLFKQPRQYIHVQPFNADQDLPDYDMDDEDFKFFSEELRERRKFEVSQITFEDMIDRLEKNSGQTVVNLKEAKMLLKEDDDLILAVYDYWLNKRLDTQQCLIPTVKTEAKEGVVGANVNPYIGFRRRTEKMQTRKNRKNDEDSYIRMLKLRRDINRSVMMLDMVKRREKMKKENLALTTEIFEKRFQAEDWEGTMMAGVQGAARKVLGLSSQAPSSSPFPLASWVNSPSPGSGPTPGPVTPQKREKRAYKKRKHKTPGLGRPPLPLGGLLLPAHVQEALSSDDDRSSLQTRQSDQDQEEEEQEGFFSFRRKAGVEYHAVVEDEEERLNTSYHLLTLPGGLGGRARDSCVGFGRRRLGRGGRLVLDRIPSRWEGEMGEDEVRPRTPPALQAMDWDPYRSRGVMAGV